jgi:hypothetical protein
MAAIALMVASAAPAAAQNRAMGSFQGLFTGHVGVVAADALSEPRLAAGVSVAVHEQDGWGAELDFGRASDAVSGAQVLDLTTYMVSATWMQPAGRIRPFGVAGAGVMQINGCDSPCNRPATTYDFGFSAGGGLLAVLNDVLAVRGDVRYFGSSAEHTDLRRAANLGFWRVSAGVTFRWAVIP